MKNKTVFLIMLVILSINIFASNEKTIVHVTDVSMDIGSRYERSLITVTAKDDDGNVISNQYTESQILYSNEKYSYVINNSNCIYLSNSDYALVDSKINSSSCVYLVFFVIIIIVFIYIKTYLTSNSRSRRW